MRIDHPAWQSQKETDMGDRGAMRIQGTVRLKRGISRITLLLAALVACLGLSSAAALAVPFEITSFSGGGLNQDLTSSTIAGAHPFELQSNFAFNEVEGSVGTQVPASNVKDLKFELPAGVVAAAGSFPHCTQAQVEEQLPETACPPNTMVGVARLVVDLGGPFTFNTPVYNLAPAPGMPAQFGMLILSSVVRISFHVRTDGDYGVTATIHNLNTAAGLYGAALSIWGVPADPAHDAVREEFGSWTELERPLNRNVIPFLSNPTTCSGPLTTKMLTDSYQDPSTLLTAGFESPGMIGCENVPFHPSLSFSPETVKAGTPSAMGVDLKLPQTNNYVGISTAALKKAVVTLPEGVTLSPAAADGLQGCSDEQFGLKSEAPATCPLASKVGTATIETPLLEKPMQGSLYLGTQLSNDPTSGQMYRLFLVASGSGVTIKLLGSVSVDPSTGQITTTFDNNPQLPFEDLHLEFKGGPRALMVTPQNCGTYTTTSVLTPWTSPEGADVTSKSFFTISEGCSSHGFTPSFIAGNQSAAAGAFSPFQVTFSRQDGEQQLSGITVKAPSGLLGLLSSVPLCPEAQAATGTCPAASQIGHVTVGAGLGSNPLYLPQAGQTEDPVYLTTGYKGAPFGLSIVTPAVAGPFDLGTVIVRAAIAVDPTTAQIVITSDPLPTMLRGVPLEIKTVNIDVDRPGFMFNSTNCEQQQVSGRMSSAEGTSVPVADGYQAVNCAKLKFKPLLSATTQGNGAENHNGASLTVNISAKQGPQAKAGDGEANIKKVDVTLPRALASRLATLQKACTAGQFAANPEGCPEASNVGSAVIRTPVLPDPLTGSAYLVSRGGAAFPDLVLVLHGDGVTINLTGNTQIKKGITYSKFETVPDAPISSFRLTLPERQFSALGAIQNLCRTRLEMPTEITAQDGAVVRQATRIAVTGCSNGLSVSRRVTKRTVNVSVAVPGAGKVTVSGKGIGTSSQSTSGRETITLRSKATRAGGFKTKAKVVFVSRSGERMTRELRVEIK